MPRDDEAQRLIAAATCERERLMLLLIQCLGLRNAELCGLRIEKIDLRRRPIVVRSKGDRDRSLPVPRFLVRPLRGWIGLRTDGFLFRSPRGGA
jgi:integrase